MSRLSLSRAPPIGGLLKNKGGYSFHVIACKTLHVWLQFIHNPDAITEDILTVVYITGSLQHIFRIIQLIVYQLQLIFCMLQLMWTCSWLSDDAAFRGVGIFFGSFRDHVKDLITGSNDCICG
ncbi:hypothetical protein BUX65_23970 [Salmonella enterica subsp. enterica serovar Javiana]|nr:hypothetical protein [Salmonella enterica subsp. enterica serovar Javiana]